MRRALVLAALAAVCCTGAETAAASPVETPGAFITRIVKEDIQGLWAKEWSDLHPGHRALITRAQYVACSRNIGKPAATGADIFRVLGVRDDTIHVRGIPQRSAKLVTINFHQRGERSGQTLELHAVAVGDHWTWILSGAFLGKIAHGHCLDGSKLKSAH